MENSDNSPRIAILGAGAVGCYFGGMLARSAHSRRFGACCARVDGCNWPISFSIPQSAPKLGATLDCGRIESLALCREQS